MFSLAIHDAVQELHNLSANGHKLDMTAFYLDDGMIAGDVRVVAEALRILERRCATLGLKLNHGKNELVLPNDTADVNLHEYFPRDLLVDRETGLSRVFTNGCFEILGASIGDGAFCNAYTFEKVQKASSLLEKISQLDDPQVASRLLRNCAGSARSLTI